MRHLTCLAVTGLAALLATGCASGATTTRGGSAPAPLTYAESPAPARTVAPAPPRAVAPAPTPRPATVSSLGSSSGGPRYDAHNPTLEQALAGARAAGKPVAVFLLATWCGFCRRLEAGALQDPTVHAAMAGYYTVHIDPDAPGGNAWRHLARSGYPTVAVLEPATGAERANWAGNRPAPDLVAKLRAGR